MKKGWKREPGRHALASMGVETKVAKRRKSMSHSQTSTQFGRQLLELQQKLKDTNVDVSNIWPAAKDSQVKGVTILFPDFRGMKFLDDYEMMMFFVWDEGGVAQAGAYESANQEIVYKKSLQKSLGRLESSDITRYVNEYLDSQLDFLHSVNGQVLTAREREEVSNLGKMEVSSLVEDAVDMIQEGDILSAEQMKDEW